MSVVLVLVLVSLLGAAGGVHDAMRGALLLLCVPGYVGFVSVIRFDFFNRCDAHSLSI